MIFAPKTLEEARTHRYAVWRGNQAGAKYIENRCAAEIYSSAGSITHQCFRENGYGINNLYCKKHASEMED